MAFFSVLKRSIAFLTILIIKRFQPFHDSFKPSPTVLKRYNAIERKITVDAIERLETKGSWRSKER
jgi:hypothetical protein